MEGPFWDPLRGTLPEASSGPFGTLLAALGEPLWPLLGTLWVLWGRPWALLGRSCGGLGTSRNPPGHRESHAATVSTMS